MNKNSALKYLKEKLNFLNPETKEAIEVLHPELRESDDEKKRKGLIFHLEELRDWKVGTMSPIKTKEHYDAWIEMLERMKEEGDPFQNIISRFSIHKYDDDKDTIFLSGVYVGEDIREKGYGSKILEVVDEVARLFDAKFICLKVMKASCAYDWYKRHGYNYHMDDGDYVWMKKEVKERWKPTKNQMDALEVASLYEVPLKNRECLVELLNCLKEQYGD